MGKPIKHCGKWRIRWTDEHGARQSLCFDSHSDAVFTLRRLETEVEEVKRGYRAPRIADKTFAELCDYWITRGTPSKL